MPLGYVRSKPKYSDQQKEVAVEHYLNHDRCLAGALKALGYPCRETLSAWDEELPPPKRKNALSTKRRAYCTLES